MAEYLLVKLAHGPAWDPARARREQDGWDDHAGFMDALVREGVVVLGGPIGDGADVLVVFDVASEAELRMRLADDPWMDRILRIESVQRWSVWLGAAAR